MRLFEIKQAVSRGDLRKFFSSLLYVQNMFVLFWMLLVNQVFHSKNADNHMFLVSVFRAMSLRQIGSTASQICFAI